MNHIFTLRHLGVLVIFRVFFLNTIWIVARESDIFLVLSTFRNDQPVPLLLGLFIFNLKVLASLVFEILFTTSFDEEFTVADMKRFLLTSGILLLSELTVFVTLLMEISDLRSGSYVIALVDSFSLLSLIINRSGYFTIWIALSLYSIGMVLYLIPWKDTHQKAMEQGAIFLFIKSLFLPI